MKQYKSWLAALALAFAAGGAWAEVTISGVKLADTVDIHGAKLQLNGAGIRYKAIFKVYVAGLYLQKKADTTEAILAMPGAKHMTVTTLREIDSGELGKLFTRGVEDNMDKSSFSKLIPGLMRMSQLFSDIKKLNAGDNFSIDWVPGTGTVIFVKGVLIGGAEDLAALIQSGELKQLLG